MASFLCHLLKAIYHLFLQIRDLSLPLIVNDKYPRKSIVRFIGTVLPLPSARRVYFNLPAWQKHLDSQTPSDIFSIEDSFQDNELNQDSSSYDTCSHETTIKQLQDELKELRMQVAAILQNQTTLSLDVTCGFQANVTVSQPPPPPPPPPPPLPLPSLMTSTPCRPKRPAQIKNNPPDLLGEVLKEMKKGRPKLKPIERSPGGRPVKRPKILTDPADILTEVLKKRFIAVNVSDTNESDCSSYSDVLSPEWKTCHYDKIDLL